MSKYSQYFIKKSSKVFGEHTKLKEKPKVNRNPKIYLYYDHYNSMNHGNVSHIPTQPPPNVKHQILFSINLSSIYKQGRGAHLYKGICFQEVDAKLMGKDLKQTEAKRLNATFPAS